MSKLKPTQSRLVSRQYGGAGSVKGRRSIDATSLTLMTIGGIMGSGLFLASGQAIHLAGPAIAIAFLIGVTVMALEVTALAEMSAVDPARGSFLEFARTALGPGPAFVGGWIFWFSSILNMAAEATAGAVFSRLWFPQVPVWAFSMGYAAIVVAINFLTVKGFSEVESGLSVVKVLIVSAFIVVGGLALFGLLPAAPGVGPHLWTTAPSFFPHGLTGVGGAMVLVLFSLSGTGVLGLAASHVKDPGVTMGKTIKSTIIGIYVLYVGAALVMTGLVPWSRLPTTKESPFIAALRAMPWSWAGDVFNVVILLAVLSAMNAGLFATDRVLETLGRIHDAPHVVAKSSHGIPRVANAVTGVLLIAVAGLAYFLPKTAYLYLVTATGFQALFVWILIVVSEIYYRPRLEKKHGKLPLRMPWFPMLSWLTVLLMVGIIATAPLAPHEVVSLGIGVIVTVLAGIVYWVVRRERLKRSSAS